MKDIDHAMQYFLSTGTIRSRGGLDLMQVTGFTIVADKLNYVRYLSHFRAIHRGQFFTEMKTTAVRKLLPDSWGFLCPVHTPDGGPCGLLNHLAQNCRLTSRPPREIDEVVQRVRKFAAFLGVQTALEYSSKTTINGHEKAALGLDSCKVSQHAGAVIGNLTNYSKDCHYPIVLDGRYIGHVRDADAADFVAMLRRAKVVSDENERAARKVCRTTNFSPATPGEIISPADEAAAADNVTLGLSSAISGPKLIQTMRKEMEQRFGSWAVFKELANLIPSDLEIAFAERSWGHIFPGIFLYIGPCRFMRPIRCLRSHSLENVGPLEQIFLKIAVSEAELIQARKLLREDILQFNRGLKKLSSLGTPSTTKKAGALEDADSPSSSKGPSGGESPSNASTASTEVETCFGLRKIDDAAPASAQLPREIEPLVYTHREIDPIRMLSIIAALTPFQNHNQSPRCMYQCQMLKQTMGTPYQNHR